MADVNANIGVNIDTSQALAQLKSLQRQISQFHTSIARSSEAAALAQKSLQKNLVNTINSIGAFSAELRTVRTSAESFTNSLEKNKFSMREYFRYAGASTRTFGKLFKSEFDTIGKVAEERVKTLQTQYIKLGRNASGAMEAIAVRPTALNMQDYGTKTAIAAQKQALFNQLMKQGTTNLLNFGKNTQWAGRQLMVGFTIPLSLVASTASKTFMEMEAQTLKFRKVYGDLFTPKAETQAALDSVIELGRQFTKYGVAVSQTVALSAEAAAAGFQGLDLQRQTTEATRLSVLGQIDSQKALETTISLQNAFGMSSENLADSINFLNAVENQTVVSLDDITTAIPKVAPVIQQLGGDVKDLTFFIAAMKEGGINASEGANALKSGLAALINPTKKASDMLAGFGINATAIIEKNKGNLKATVIEFANALNTLDPLARSRAIEQMFGKFQFARLSTLFANVARDGNQAARVLDLANASVEELSALSEQELGMTADSAMNKFKKSVEDLKLALVPVGQAFLEAATPIVEFVGGVLEKFGNLSDGTKRLITLLTVGIGAIGPIFLMTFGLLANGLANTLKGALILRQGYLRLTGQSQVLGEQTQYLNSEQLEAAAAAHSLDQTHAKLTQTFNVEREALTKLIAAYQSANTAARNFAFNNPGMMLPGRAAKKFASGIVSVPGPKGAGDIVPAMLSPGEAVIPSKMVQKYAPLINGMVADNIPGYENGNIIFGGRNFSVTSKGQVGIQQIINETRNLSSVIENIDDLILNSLINAENELTAKGRVRIKSLQEQLKTIGDGIIPLSKTTQAVQGGFRGNAGVVATHGTPSRMISALEAQALGRQLGSGVVADQLINTSQTARLFSNLTFPMPAAFNKAQLTGAEAAKFIGQNRTRFTSMIAEQHGLNPNDPGLLAFGTSIGQALKRVGNNVVSETDFENTIATGIENMLEGAAKTALTRSRDTFSTVQIGGIPGRERHGGIARFNLPSSASGQIFNEMQLGNQSYRQQDISKYNASADKFIIETIKQRTKNFGSSMVIAVEEGLRETLQVASPSRKMKQIGKDAGQGLILGALEYVDDAKQVGARLGAGMVQTASGLFVPGGATGQPSRTTGGGVPLSVITQNVPVSEGILTKTKNIYTDVNQKIEDQNKKIKISNERLNNLNKNVMGASFAISALSGITSATNGRLGKFSEILFKITGPLFAFSTILQLLGGSNIIGLLSKLKVLATGPVGLVIAGLTALYGINKLYNSSQEKARMKIEGLGRAASVSASQLKDIGKIVGKEPSKDPLKQENLTPTGGNQGQNARRSQIDEFKNLFQDKGADSYKENQNTINQLKNASKQQADLIFSSLAIKFAGDFDEKTVQNILIALRETAGRQDLELDFKKLNINTEEGINNLDSTVSKVTDNFYKEMDRILKDPNTASPERMKNYGLDPATVYETLGAKSLKTAAFSIQNILSGIALQFKNGVINAEEFSKATNAVFSKLSSPEFKNSSNVLVNEILKNIGTETALAATEVEKLSDKLMFLEGIMLGISTKETNNLITIMEQAKLNPQDTALQISVGLQVASYRKTLRDRKQLQEELNKIENSGGGDGVKKEKLTYDKSYSIVNNFFNAQEALIKQQRKSEADLLQTKIDNAQAAVDAAEKEIDAKQKIIDTTQREIDLLNRRIELEFDRPIQKLQDESTILNNNLEIIRRQEDAINNQYDTQIQALEKISSANKEIANQEKSRLDIASALTSGDVAAAAQAVQESRAQAAASQIEKQQTAIEASRQQTLAGITAGGMTKDQIEARTYQINQQVFTLEQQRKTLQAEIVVLQDKNYLVEQQIYDIKQKSVIPNQQIVDSTKLALDQYNKQTESLFNNLTYLGKTKTQWEETNTKIEAANATLATQELSLKGINKLIDEIKGKYEKMSSAPGINPFASSSLLTPQQKAAAQKAEQIAYRIGERMYGGKILPMSMGGMVPKYFASGGRIGSDSVPALLTPGEFVMNRRASEQFGPLLSMLNESKYPSMIGPSYGGTGSRSPKNISIKDNSTDVYNYNVGISVGGTNVSADKIAKTVMNEIKYLDAQRVRGQRVS